MSRTAYRTHDDRGGIDVVGRTHKLYDDGGLGFDMKWNMLGQR